MCRSSVTRMSGDQKQNVIQRTSEEERASLASLHPTKNDEKIINSISPEESEDAETGNYQFYNSCKKN